MRIEIDGIAEYMVLAKRNAKVAAAAHYSSEAIRLVLKYFAPIDGESAAGVLDRLEQRINIELEDLREELER